MGWIYWYLGDIEGMRSTLYVGKTLREPWDRQAEHRRKAWWYGQVDGGRCEIYVGLYFNDLYRAEQAAIDVLQPWYNERAAVRCCQRYGSWRCDTCRKDQERIRSLVMQTPKYDRPWHLDGYTSLSDCR